VLLASNSEAYESETLGHGRTRIRTCQVDDEAGTADGRPQQRGVGYGSGSDQDARLVGLQGGRRLVAPTPRLERYRACHTSIIGLWAASIATKSR